MPLDFNIPEELYRADFCRLIFHIQFSESFELTSEAFLRLRRGLLQAAKDLESDSPGCLALQLFEPELATDPVARRRFQRPAPCFVLVPPILSFGACSVGQTVPLEVLFFGSGMSQLPLFFRTLKRLGKQGLFLGKGPFEIRMVDSLDASGNGQLLSDLGEPDEPLSPAVNHCGWWLENQAKPFESLQLSFVTPARLLSNGRPLFEPEFEQIFPFILRRVTSMLYAHCELELIDDPMVFLNAAGEVEVVARSLKWEDWRTLSGRQDLGGVTGRLELAGPGLSDILWILHLGSLLQIGKGASYGAGCFQLKPAP